jgi:uncharacterized protein
VTPRVVFDTTTVVSALCFPVGRLAWLRIHWRERRCVPLLSSTTAAELLRVLGYPKLRLSSDQQQELLGDYVPFCEIVGVVNISPWRCRDPKDQPFLDLAWSGGAGLLVTGDRDLLSLSGLPSLVIESPEAYRQRIAGEFSG